MNFVTEFEIVSIIILSALLCSIPGTFLILRNNYYVADTVNRSAVLGITIAFLYTNSLSSPFVILNGALTGFISIVLVSVIERITGFRAKGISIVISSGMLAIGLLYAYNIIEYTSFDISSIYLGETAYAFFDRVRVFGIDIGAYSTYYLISATILSILLLSVFYRHLKISTIDKGYAQSINMNTNQIDLIILFITALSISISFQTAGVFMTTAFLLGPAAIARFYTNKLLTMAIASIFICSVSTMAGFTIAWQNEVSIAGTIVSFIGIFFFTTVLIAPEEGLIGKFIEKKKNKYIIEECILLDIIINNETENNNEKYLQQTLNWDEHKIKNVINRLLHDNKVEIINNIPTATNKGREYIEHILFSH